MVRDTVIVEEQWGALLAKAYDDAGTQTNHWFHETTDGAWMHHSEVIHYTGPEGSHKRHFVKDGKMMLPDAVKQAVEAEGYTVEEVRETRSDSRDRKSPSDSEEQ